MSFTPAELADLIYDSGYDKKSASMIAKDIFPKIAQVISKERIEQMNLTKSTVRQPLPARQPEERSGHDCNY